MAEILDLTTFTDSRGNLTVVEKVFSFEIKRVYYIYGVDDSVRGGHRHKKTFQAAICLQGKCDVENNDGQATTVYHLDSPSKCLLINPGDWHIMKNFSPDTILMVLASEYYDADDYIFEPYA